jgi:hypothetical protein
MTPVYTRFEDLFFKEKKLKVFAKTLLDDIHTLENVLIEEDIFLEKIKETMGDEFAAKAAGPMVYNNKRILYGLKLTFWYYTGVSPNTILDTKMNIDIFNP